MLKQTMNVAVLVSGGGTNLQAILDEQEKGNIKSGKVVLVISDQKGAYALSRARDHGIRAEVVARRECASQKEFEERIRGLIEECGIDLMVLAGFLSILSEDFTADYPKRIINIHPSLIPSFCGRGFYGLRVHEAALAKGVKVSGATVHFVNEIPDGGEIIFQKAVEVEEGDTPEILQRRIMEQAEWKLLPMAVEKVCSDMLKEEIQ
ncbi:MAG: phosphoribosylglycinamide formyltransferase [Eubacteriaceae bacterium]|nr:phosphoribosylglycinamide formyltransferase [Eubacteriaceae bacterium]